jgi:hypothetical protein
MHACNFQSIGSGPWPVLLEHLNMSLSPVSQYSFDALHEIKHAGYLEPVKYLFATFVVLDDPGLFQYGKMFGYRRKIGVDIVDELTYAVFAFSQALYNPEAGRVSQSLEYRSFGFV